MLPLCPAPTNCSSHTKAFVYGGFKSFSPYCIAFDANCKQFVAIGINARSLYRNRLPNLRQCALRNLGSNDTIFVENSHNSAADNQLVDYLSNRFDDTNVELVTPFNTVKAVFHPISDFSNAGANSVSFLQTKFSDVVSKLSEAAANTFNKGEDVLNDLSDRATSSLTNALTKTNQVVDNSIAEIISFINKSGGSAGSKLRESSRRVGPFVVDVLRGTIIVVEKSLVKGGEIAAYAYSSVKGFLPPKIQEAVSVSEESVEKVLNSAGAAFQQVYMAVEGFEESLGLDPKDPLVPFIFFVAVSGTLWGSYRIIKYSGYAGDLSPQSVFELLQGYENVVLIDIRPESLKMRDGVPDLRRGARFRYAGVTLPEIDESVKKLLKGGRDIEDILLAALIRNLKIVDEKSKVVVMDADGSCSKGVARSLRRLGTKEPYLVRGGYRSWVKNGLRIKMLKPETALVVINEEAEAILEEIKPTPLKIVGYGVVFAAATYSVVEWEKTLQFIGVIGLSQSLYRRVASYEDVEDLKKDIRLLLTPVRLGGQAISWASGKVGSNGNELPTSPSSSDVQNRVLQAAAKHESQQSGDEEDSSSETDENVNN